MHLMGLQQVAVPKVNLKPLINTILAGKQQGQQEQVVGHLDRELRETTSVATWLGIKTLPGSSAILAS